MTPPMLSCLPSPPTAEGSPRRHAQPFACSLRGGQCLRWRSGHKSTAFKKIGSLPSQIGFIDITALYQTHFRVPGPGYKIALELMGVAPGGYHTAGLFVFGIINDPTAQAMVSDPNSMDNDAPALLKVG